MPEPTFYDRAKTRVKVWWTGRTPAFRAAAVTGFWAFVGPFATTILPFMSALQEWLSGDQADFPDVRILGKAAMAGVGAVVGLAGNYVHRRIKPPSFDASEQPSVEEVVAK